MLVTFFLIVFTPWRINVPSMARPASNRFVSQWIQGVLVYVLSHNHHLASNLFMFILIRRKITCIVTVSTFYAK